MKLNIDEIPEEGVSIMAESRQDDWLRRVFERALAEQIAAGDTLKLELTASLIGEQVMCVGGFYYSIHPTCARCGTLFEWQEQVPFHHHYIPAGEAHMGRKAHREEEIEVAEDEDFSIYEGRTVDLDPMLYEHLLLAQPTIFVCNEECKGLCPQCGANLNDGPCRCAPMIKAHPFDALKDLKIEKK